MRSSLLCNPFDTIPEPAPARSGQGPRITPVCSTCRSDDIVSQATVQWSNEAQEWQLADTFEQPAYCNGCNKPCALTWMPLN
jgi:hypothetical protein